MKKPVNYYCHKSVLTEQQKVEAPYQIIQKIGQGAFGQVYKVFDPENCQLMVMKKQKKQAKTKTGFKKESNIMMEMSQSQGFAKVNKVQLKEDNQYVVMSILGQNLGSIIDKHAKVSVYSMKRMATQLISRLKQLHDHKYVHRDLKPQNILLGNNNNPHIVYLVDFGLTHRYNPSAKIARKIYQGIVGTARYCSIAAHEGLEQFPKDDLESLGYILVYLATGTLPWKTVPGKKQEEKFKFIKEKKQKCQVSELSGGINCLRKYFTYIKSLEVNQNIKYDILQGFFKVPSKMQYCYQFCQEKCRGKDNNIESKSELGDEQPHIGNLRQFVI